MKFLILFAILLFATASRLKTRRGIENTTAHIDPRASKCYKNTPFIQNVKDLVIDKTKVKIKECLEFNSKTITELSSLTSQHYEHIHPCLQMHHIEKNDDMIKNYSSGHNDDSVFFFPSKKPNNYCSRRNRFQEIYSYRGNELLIEEYINGAKFDGSIQEVGGKYSYQSETKVKGSGTIFATNAPLGNMNDLTAGTEKIIKVHSDKTNQDFVCKWEELSNKCKSRGLSEGEQDLKTNTVYSFWKAVAENKIKVAVQLTNFAEYHSGCGPINFCKIKADKYYPFKKGDKMIVKRNENSKTEQFTISCDDEMYDSTLDAEVRKLSYAYEGRTIKVKHYFFKGWPDFGDPKDQMFKLVDLVATKKAKGSNIIAHCTGGVGRTGTFIGSVLIQEAGKRLNGYSPNKKFGLIKYIMKLRESRNNAVEAPSQINFLYKVIKKNLKSN